MTAGGWLFMLGSLTFVWALAAWCVRRWFQPRVATGERPDPDDGSAPGRAPRRA